jgi:murein DD-endopeptidase MepM/ murein hydrolase activator NlpD
MRFRHAFLAPIPLFLLAYATWAPAAVPVEMSVQARELVPGEPVRIVASSAVPLRSLSGSALGSDLTFVRDDRGTGGAETWSAWAVIALNREPGTTAVEVSGTTMAGEEVAGTLALTVAAKEFPEERLNVESKYVEPPKETLERIRREKEKVGAIYVTRTPVPVSAKPFVRPVPGEPTSIFGTRRIFNGVPRSPHSGLDLRAATGTPVLASGDGKVVLAEEFYYSGNLVIVDHGGGLYTLYAHLSRIDVAAGDALKAGDVVGLSGATGRVTAPHLHWGAKIGSVPFDPRALLDPALFD